MPDRDAPEIEWGDEQWPWQVVAHRGACSAFLAVLVACVGLVGAGRSSAEPNIIGGAPAAAGQLPSMAYVQFANAAGENFSCTGTVVAPTLVLTAAHCGFAYPGRYTIVIEVPDIDDASSANIFHVSATARDPDYAGQPGADDAALLTLTSPTGAPPVTLAGNSANATALAGASARIAGGRNRLRPAAGHSAADGEHGHSAAGLLQLGLRPLRRDPATVRSTTRPRPRPPARGTAAAHCSPDPPAVTPSRSGSSASAPTTAIRAPRTSSPRWRRCRHGSRPRSRRPTECHRR